MPAALLPTPDATEPLLTADQFLEKYGHMSGVELVNGRVMWEHEDAPMDRGVPNSKAVVIEVRSPTVRQTRILAKVLEYLDAGVTVVVVIDPVGRDAIAYRADVSQQFFRDGDTLTLPDVLPGFELPLAKLFE